MSVQYLVDFENVHEAGLFGMDRLAAEDSVYIFHTASMDRITLSLLDDVQAWVKVISVPPGNQSLDMHLWSFLGYLIGKGNEDDIFAIVSHDRGYRTIADFWNKAYQRNDKVHCIHGINYALGIANPDAWLSIPADGLPIKDTVREFIFHAFGMNPAVKNSGAPCMHVSKLCSVLKDLPAFALERQRTRKKPLAYLTDECRDFLWIRKDHGQDLAYLITMPEIGTPFDGTGDETACDETAVQPDEQAVSTETGSEEELPDIMAIGDLNIDEEPEFTAPPSDTDQPDPEQTVKEPDFFALAEAFIRSMDDADRDDSGHARASALRDQLLTLPEFRTALKESGMKPIQYMQVLFEGRIEIRREKGIFRAALVKNREETTSSESAGNDEDRRKTELTDRRKSFYDAAFSNIRNRLSGAGFDQAIAEEIAGICMRSEAAVEPRKEIHTLLCQRFGPKTGAKYYRQTVKYICA